MYFFKSIVNNTLLVLLALSIGIELRSYHLDFSALWRFVVTCSAGLGTITLTTVTFAWTYLDALAAPALWLFLIGFIALPPTYKHWLLGLDPNIVSHPLRVSHARYKRFVRHRRRQHRRSRHHHRHIRHHGLATRQRRPKNDDAIFDLIQHILAFAERMSIRRARRE